MSFGRVPLPQQKFNDHDFYRPYLYKLGAPARQISGHLDKIWRNKGVKSNAQKWSKID